MGLVLAVCEGGDDTAAVIVSLIVLAVWLSITATIIRGEDTQRRSLLIALFVMAVLLGAASYFLGSRSLDEYFGIRSLFPLLGAGAIAVIAARLTPALGSGRALAVALLGGLLMPGGLIVLIFASFAIGSACFS
jgi:hypothetical protein